MLIDALYKNETKPGIPFSGLRSQWQWQLRAPRAVITIQDVSNALPSSPPMFSLQSNKDQLLIRMKAGMRGREQIHSSYMQNYNDESKLYTSLMSDASLYRRNKIKNLYSLTETEVTNYVYMTYRVLKIVCINVGKRQLKE